MVSPSLISEHRYTITHDKEETLLNEIKRTFPAINRQELGRKHRRFLYMCDKGVKNTLVPKVT